MKLEQHSAVIWKVEGSGVISHSNNATEMVACKMGWINLCEGDSWDTVALWNSLLGDVTEANCPVRSTM